jgi:hypothetical protein
MAVDFAAQDKWMLTSTLIVDTVQYMVRDCAPERFM